MVKITYDSFVEKIVDSILSSENIFENNYSKQFHLNLFCLFIDKLDLETFYDEFSLTKEDYKIYFRNTKKIYNPIGNLMIEDNFEEEEKSNES